MSTSINILSQLQLLTQISTQVLTSKWLTPLNVSEEREKFLAQSNQNPRLVYNEIPSDLLKTLLTQLSSLESYEEDNSLEAWIFQRKKEELKLEIELLLHRGETELSAISCKLYQCTFPKASLEKAQVDSAQNISFENQETIDRQKIVESISSYLAGYNVHDWEVSLVPDSDFYFRVRANLKKILISQRFNFDFCDLDNVLAHEIDGHVIRGINSRTQTNPLLQKPFPFYIKTEEGLASFLGDYCSTTADISRKHHALKYLAGYLGLKSSFVEIYEFLVEHGFTPDLAFQRTLRLKRGFENTGLPGCFAKEAMYYEGMLEVKDFIDHGGSIEKLYSGKLGLNDLQFAEIPSNIIVPQRLKNYVEKRKKTST